MTKLNDLLGDLRKSVDEIISGPEEGRADLLEKSFREFGEAAALIEEDRPIDGGAVLAKMGAAVVEAAGLDDDTGGIAELAGILQGVEGLLDRLAGDAGSLSKSDDEADMRKAAASAGLHELVDGWYGLGVRLLEVAAAADGGAELPDLGGDDIAQIEDDFDRVRAGIGLAKAAPPVRKGRGEDDGEADEADEEMEGGEEPEIDDEEPLDPLDTMQRLCAALMVTIDAVRNADGAGAEEEADYEEADEAVDGVEKSVMAESLAKAHALVAEAEIHTAAEAEILAARAEADRARLAKEAAAAELKKAQDDRAAAEEELRRLRSQPSAPRARLGGAQAVSKADDNGGVDLSAKAESLAKLAERDPSAVTRELIKLAQGNRIQIG
ncbi:hypothetical protein [Falsiroseomonas sp. CW058]|uniref:hypothetical protein n=1 Tax=Falsiroseomonas sp. CW058 TaxID=3388664 RepID=UPI003D3100F7